MNNYRVILRVVLLLTGLVLLLTLAACGTPAANPEPANTEPPATDEETPVAESETETPSATNTPTMDPTAVELTEPEMAEGVTVITPVLETISVLDDIDEAPGDEHLGDADDPAIWVHPDDPALSLVVGVLKEGGLDVYDLDGKVLQSINPEGVRYNNVDLAYNFPLGDDPIDIVVVTDRFKDLLVIFQVAPETRRLTDITDPDSPMLFTPEGEESDEETTAYGVAVFQDPESNTFYAFANRRDTGEIAQFELVDTGDNTIGWNKVRTMNVPPPEGGEAEDAQTEGMVVDPEARMLYVGQENGGIWKFSAAPDGESEGTMIHPIAPASDYLVADVEGLTLYFGPDGQGYLIASSQGDNTFAVFDREGDNEYIGSFQIGATGDAADDIDGVQECDGAMALNIPLGERFPNGLLVVQDGHNVPLFPVEDDDEIENANTNFKFVPWENVARAFDPPLMIDTTSYHPHTP